MKKYFIALCAVLLLLTGTSCSAKKVERVTSSETLYVRPIEGLPDDFLMAADVSSLLTLENSGVQFYDYEGQAADPLSVLAQSGINAIRVRVWNDPFDSQGHGYGGGNCDINTAIELGKRAAEYGLGLIVDFHYSDFWADPSKQQCPKAWQGMDIEAKAAALYEYTSSCLKALKKAKVKVIMVQLGNETNGAMAGETIWMNIINYLMKEGSRAVREVFPKALVAVHFANPENADSYYNYAKKLDYYQLDYDVFGTSYYPFWHGTLENLSTVLGTIAKQYDKKVMVLETSYPYSTEDFDFNGNTISSASTITQAYPFSVQGQANSLLDLIDTVQHIADGLGICYWEPAWIPVGTTSYEENQLKWETYGSGWASSYAKEYDPNDAGKYYGGSAVDNQALFDASGHPLESLKTFALAHSGNTIALSVESITPCEVMADLNGPIVLPDTVQAVMNDGSKQDVSISWAPLDETALRQGGVQNYEITGTTADGQSAICHLHMIKYNYLKNYSFEEDSHKTAVPEGWKVLDLGKEDELFVEDKTSDSLSGTKHFHFWTQPQNSICFDLCQEVSDLPSGTYQFSIALMGGDGLNQKNYAYVKVNGVLIASIPMAVSSYNVWDQITSEPFALEASDQLCVGIHIEMSGSGKGAWGKIDDALLNSVN